MTSRFERRLARVEKLRRPVPDPPDPRMFVIATLVGFHCCPRRDDTYALVTNKKFWDGLPADLRVASGASIKASARPRCPRRAMRPRRV